MTEPAGPAGLPGPAALTGRTALVTGGGSGLGATIATHLAGAGARVIVAGRRVEPLQETAAAITSAGGSAGGSAVRAEQVDVADADSVASLAERLADVPVSILVNNAGVPGPVAPLTEIEPDDWDEVFAVNVRGTYLMCRAFLPGMFERRGGDIINLASVSGKRPLVRRTPYCASKMAVIGLTTTLAFEAGPYGVRVNSLSPGYVDSDRMDRNFRLEAERTGTTYEAARQTYVGRAALGRMVTRDEVGRAAVAMLAMEGLSGSDVDLSAGMVA